MNSSATLTGCDNIIKRLRESPPDTPVFHFADELYAVFREIERLRAENDALAADARRLDWIEARALERKIEIAKSIFGTGFEIGLHPSGKAVVINGSLRAAIDAAMEQTK